MDIVRIFETKDTFWCPCYPEDKGEDIFTVLLRQLTDTQYLTEFFKNNQKDLKDPYWQGISINDAIDLVQDEAYYLQEKLICIEYPTEPGCGKISVNDIFRPLRKHHYVINVDVDHFVKGKLDSLPQMIRLYGVELDDGTIVLSGGAIKICTGMSRKHLQNEKEKLENLYTYLRQENINNVKDLKSLI